MTAAQAFVLTPTRFVGGLWEGVLTAATDDAPQIEASHDGTAIAGMEVAPMPGKTGHWAVRLAIPATVLGDGVQTVLLHHNGAVLAKVTILAGPPLDEDLRAEIGLLRAELDLLKRAFQRQSRG